MKKLNRHFLVLYFLELPPIPPSNHSVSLDLQRFPAQVSKMKFRDGMWLTAQDMRIEYAEDVYTITEKKNGLSLLCPTRHIRSRGDTLNLSTLTIVRQPSPCCR